MIACYTPLQDYIYRKWEKQGMPDGKSDQPQSTMAPWHLGRNKSTQFIQIKTLELHKELQAKEDMDGRVELGTFETSSMDNSCMALKIRT